jgi:LytS/YehU family sensor histidine kinase
VSDVFDAYRGAAEIAGVTLSMEIPPNAVPYLGDAQRLQQVFGNLLSNAIKFTTSPGGRVDICMEKLDTLVRISVRDEGRGIEPEFLPPCSNRSVKRTPPRPGVMAASVLDLRSRGTSSSFTAVLCAPRAPAPGAALS